MNLDNDSLESLLRQLAPCDLDGIGVYPTNLSEGLPSDWLPSGMLIYAYTSPNMDLVLKPYLGDRWHGRGIGMVINDLVIRGHVWHMASDPDDGDLRHQLFEQRVLSSTIHELAHSLEKPIDLPPLAHGVADAEREAVSTWCVDPKAIENDWQPAPWLCHCGKFLRNILHLRHRAILAGVDVPLCLLSDPNQYGHHPLAWYESAIGDEPERFMEKSFAEIRETRPPEQFERLWKRDVAAWWASVKKPTSLDTFVLGQYLKIFDLEKTDNVNRNI